MKSTCHNSPVQHYRNGNYCPVCFKEQSETKIDKWVLYLVFSILLMIPSNPVKAPSIGRAMGFNSEYNIGTEDIVPTDSSVLNELIKNKCVLASVAVAQARIESANYTSGIALSNKNLFGIKVHNCKYVTGKMNGHAAFASFRDNIACYCEIQRRYLSKIDKAYAEDSLYTQKVKQMK